MGGGVGYIGGEWELWGIMGSEGWVVVGHTFCVIILVKMISENERWDILFFIYIIHLFCE